MQGNSLIDQIKFIITAGIIVTIIVFAIHFRNPEFSKGITPDEYYTEAIVANKEKTKKSFGREEYFIKFKVDDDLQIVDQTTVHNYMEYDKGQTVYLILNSKKNHINREFTSKKEFEKYLEDNENTSNFIPYSK